MGEVVDFISKKAEKQQNRQELISYLTDDQLVNLIDDISSYFPEIVDNLSEQDYNAFSEYIYCITFMIQSIIHSFDTSGVVDEEFVKLHGILKSLFSLWEVDDSNLKEAQTKLESLIYSLLLVDNIDSANAIYKLFYIVSHDTDDIDEPDSLYEYRKSIIANGLLSTDEELLKSMCIPIIAAKNEQKFLYLSSSIGEDKFNKICDFISSELGETQ